MPAGQQATYRFVVESASPQQTVAGFDVAASAGTLEAIAGSGARAEFGELLHGAPKANSDGAATWEFLWRAPEQSGRQTIYASGLSANDDGTNGGDASAATILDVEVVAAPCLGDCDADGDVRIERAGARRQDRHAGLRFRGMSGIRSQLRRGGVDRRTDGCGPERSVRLRSRARTDHHTDAHRDTDRRAERHAGPVLDEDAAADAGRRAAGVEHLWRQPGTHLLQRATKARITRDTVGSLRPKWRYQTAAIVTASPIVAYVDVPGEGRIKVVIAPSWDGNVYALRATNGTQAVELPHEAPSRRQLPLRQLGHGRRRSTASDASSSAAG